MALMRGCYAFLQLNLKTERRPLVSSMTHPLHPVFSRPRRHVNKTLPHSAFPERAAIILPVSNLSTSEGKSRNLATIRMRHSPAASYEYLKCVHFTSRILKCVHFTSSLCSQSLSNETSWCDKKQATKEETEAAFLFHMFKNLYLYFANSDKNTI